MYKITPAKIEIEIYKGAQPTRKMYKTTPEKNCWHDDHFHFYQCEDEIMICGDFCDWEMGTENKGMAPNVTACFFLLC